jgi:hypothetical protein
MFSEEGGVGTESSSIRVRRSRSRRGALPATRTDDALAEGRLRRGRAGFAARFDRRTLVRLAVGFFAEAFLRVFRDAFRAFRVPFAFLTPPPALRLTMCASFQTLTVLR